MAITYAVNSVLDRFSKAVIAALTAAGEAPQSLPRATTARQAAFSAAALPRTVIGQGALKTSEENANVGSLRQCLEVTLHHVRGLEPGGSAVETGTLRLAAVAAALYEDYRLEAVSQPADQSVEMVRVLGILAGDDDPVQALLDQADEDAALVCVSLKLEIDWVESPDLPVAP